MERLIWKKVDRKRQNNIHFDDSNYVLGYDLDMEDFTALVTAYNQRTLLNNEENRLYDHIRTMINIVLENPKIQPSKDEIPDIIDCMFMDGWGSMKYIKDGRKPYSYVYRSMFTAACRYYKNKQRKREREDAIETHIQEVFNEWFDSVTDHKVRGDGTQLTL